MAMIDFSSNLDELAKRLRETLEDFPRHAANVSQRFFVERFAQGGWIDIQRERWPDRKRGARYKKGSSGAGRAILVKSGRLRRSIRVARVTRTGFTISTDVPYARAHNEGVQKSVRVRGHNRRRGGKTYKVAAHSRNMGLPRRQFMGASRHLSRLLVRELIDLLRD